MVTKYQIAIFYRFCGKHAHFEPTYLFLIFIDKIKDELYEFKARVVKRKKNYLRIIFKRSENISASFMQLKPFDLTAI